MKVAALVGKGLALRELGRSEVELAAYDQVVDRFSRDSNVWVGEQVAEALVNKGVTPDGLDRSREALAVYDQLVDRFGDDPLPGVRQQVGKAMFNKCLRL